MDKGDVSALIDALYDKRSRYTFQLPEIRIENGAYHQESVPILLDRARIYVPIGDNETDVYKFNTEKNTWEKI